jgi:hypothetical protein
VWLGVGDAVRDLPREFRPSAPVPRGVDEVHVFCAGCLVAGAPRFADEPEAPARLASDPAFAGWPLVVLSDEPARAAASDMNFLWTTFTRFEPARDIHAARVAVCRNHLVFDAPIVIDARTKPGFPGELFCDDETSALVTRRWREYFPQGDVEMGDSGLAHLSRAAGSR